ncbi:Cd2+/Zn2+-exporting ATPase [Dyadobacter jejuensis]|uniref:P-type Zn(2+) transporter n=1 Tax=Dyadobacter jejuensis TaxID=1082580 RepID=A0A316AD77_9BACT|nr:heavy metal translocating P-type ATPase [Dyadobacter jejuensis]PWJ55562.1 Cd2+/Zn2+-exporting ATPase [Dyadobacter jejuensis]
MKSKSKAKEHDHKGQPSEHDHHHHGPLGEATELTFSLMSGAALAMGFLLTFMHEAPTWVSLSLYMAAYFFGGYFTTKEAVETVRKGGFEIDFLMLVAALGAAFLGEWAEGALLLFLFSLGHALEHYALGKAQKSIASLSGLAPPTALLLVNGQQIETPVERLRIGDRILIKPNSKIPADALVVAGEGPVDQAPITGESIPVIKTAFPSSTVNQDRLSNIPKEHRVFSGTINGSAAMEAQVLKTSGDSTIARLIRLVRATEKQKSPTQLFTDKFERYFVPAVLLLVLGLCFAFLVIDEPFSTSFYRAMAVLVAASPCALAISTPSAVLSGVARAANGGVLIKGGRPLEDLGTLSAIAFDKTGTLTEGKPSLTHLIALSPFSETELLKYAVALERLSDHPLAAAIVKGAQAYLNGVDIPQARQLQAVAGKGIEAQVGHQHIKVGNKAFFEEEEIPEVIINQMIGLEKEGHTTMLVRKDKDWMGLIGVMDVPRKGAQQVLKRLSELGIRQMVMLTGDNQRVANAVARQIGIDRAWGDLMPDDKVKAIAKLTHQETKVAMVGDGVNDAPAMAMSTVGIAMGAAGSDVALETADIALLGDDLQGLPFAIGLSRQAHQIIQQNLWISLGMVAVLIPLTLLGYASIGPAVLAHEGSTLLVVLNALRLLLYKSEP